MLKCRSIVLAIFCALMRVMTAIAQDPAGLLQPSLEHKRLGVFVGTWEDQAEMKPSPLGPGGKMCLTETCEWFTGGFSVVCHTDATGFMGGLKTLTVLTYDAEEKVYRLYEFNSVGWTNSGKGTVDGDTWTFDGESKMRGKVVKSRTTIKLVSPDSATLKSEMWVEGGTWTLVMDLKGNRLNQSQADLNSCVPHASEGWPFELLECYRKLLNSH